jgi:hypothetical protein
VAAQLWAVNTFFTETVTVGVGVGPYVYIDRRHPPTGDHTPAALAPLVSITAARRMGDHWTLRLIWHRVASTYNRDADIFLLGVGYRWK